MLISGMKEHYILEKKRNLNYFYWKCKMLSENTFLRALEQLAGSQLIHSYCV